MITIDIQVSRSKVKPTFHMLGKRGICVLQTTIFSYQSKAHLFMNAGSLNVWISLTGLTIAFE